MSSSVGPQNFDIMKSFVQAIVRVLSIGPDETRVGVITFSRYPHIPIHIHDYTNENDLIKAIDRIVYETGSSFKVYSSNAKMLKHFFFLFHTEKNN